MKFFFSVVLLNLLGFGTCQYRNHNGMIARQPVPSRSGNSPSLTPPSCTNDKVTGCLAHLMRLNITAITETFQVYELLSFTNVDEPTLRKQAQVTSDACKVFNEFNDCTGGNFLECFEKKKFVEIIQAFAGIKSGSGASSTIKEIAANINDEQVDFVGKALMDVCKRIHNGEVQLAELAMCIRKDKDLLKQLETLTPDQHKQNNQLSGPVSPSSYPLVLSQHCRVFRCDVSRTLVHMLVQAASKCSNNGSTKFIFWVGQIALTGVKRAAPSEVVIANGAQGTKTDSLGNDQCVLRDADFDLMTRQRPATFADLGITRASELCAEEVATTTTTVFLYDAERPRESFKVAMEATLDDLHNDLFWEESASSRLAFDLFFIISFVILAVVM